MELGQGTLDAKDQSCESGEESVDGAMGWESMGGGGGEGGGADDGEGRMAEGEGGEC